MSIIAPIGRPGGAPSRQDSTELIIRDLQARVAALERFHASGTVGPAGPPGTDGTDGAPGATGPPGPPSDPVQTFTQSSPATVWTVVHGLGRDPCGLQVYDSTGALREFPTVQQVDSNTTTITFLTAVSGVAVYN